MNAAQFRPLRMGQTTSLAITAAFPVAGLLLMLLLGRLENGLHREPQHRRQR